MKNKNANVLCYLFSGIFILFIGILMVMSLFMHCETSLSDYDQTKSITQHTFFLYMGLALMGMVVAGVLCFWLEGIFLRTGKGEKISNGICTFCGLAILLAGIFWIFFNDSVPAYDQKTVYMEAQRIAGFLAGDFETEYFAYFSRNRGMALLAAMAMKIFGNHLYSFRIINLLAVMVIYYTICRFVKLVFRNPVVLTLTSLLLMAFYPLIIYTSYHYGTLLSIAFTSLGRYGTAALCETGKRWYAAAVVLGFPLGILMHQSAAIGLAAAIIYLLMNGRGKVLLRNVLISIMAVFMVFLAMRVIDGTYIQITGADPEADSVPVSCTVYMGLTSTMGASGPGSQDGADARIFVENDCDGKVANQVAMDGIFTTAKEYVTGKRSLNFFVEKIKYQWLDPTFGARKTIRMNDTSIGEPVNSAAFAAFYESSLREIVFKVSIGAMMLVYLCALIAGVRSIMNNKEGLAVILVQLYVIGGGAFQLIWESLSRYCLGYFIWLLPLSAYGLWSLLSLLKKRSKRNV